MRSKASCLAGGLCCLCAAGILALNMVWPGVEPAQQARPAFYGQEVLDDIEVVAPEDALGKADGRFAEIRPGGEMTILMDDRIYYSDASDDGSVVTKGEGKYGLAGLFRMTEEGEPAWQPLNPGGTPGGFKLGSAMFPVAQSTDTIKIVNDDTRPVFVDAVLGYRSEIGRTLQPATQGLRRTKRDRTTSGRRP
ncbi:MAG: hypothetical protein WCC00_11205 [Candidatus Aminicenantales bacterium]